MMASALGPRADEFASHSCPSCSVHSNSDAAAKFVCGYEPLA